MSKKQLRSVAGLAADVSLTPEVNSSEVCEQKAKSHDAKYSFRLVQLKKSHTLAEIKFCATKRRLCNFWEHTEEL